MTDEWTAESLAIEVDERIRSCRVIEVPSRLISERGAQLFLRSDNGPAFVSRALLKWIVDQGIETSLTIPANPGRTRSWRSSTAACGSVLKTSRVEDRQKKTTNV